VKRERARTATSRAANVASSRVCRPVTRVTSRPTWRSASSLLMSQDCWSASRCSAPGRPVRSHWPPRAPRGCQRQWRLARTGDDAPDPARMHHRDGSGDRIPAVPPHPDSLPRLRRRCVGSSTDPALPNSRAGSRQDLPPYCSVTRTAAMHAPFKVKRP
jgi:hypothetical protein